MQEINKKDFFDLLNYALEEYYGRTMTELNIISNGKIMKNLVLLQP